MWQYRQNGELYHYGTKGQKWGVRRFQNKDGSLTPAGKKRVAKMKAQYAELTGKQLGRSSAKPMSDAELREKITRLQLEKNYLEVSKQLAAYNPQKVSLGKRFVKTVGKDIVAPTATKVGRAYLEKMMREQLGLPTGAKKKKKEKDD